MSNVRLCNIYIKVSGKFCQTIYFIIFCTISVIECFCKISSFVFRLNYILRFVFMESVGFKSKFVLFIQVCVRIA